MDGSKERPKVTAGVDVVDKYSYLCLLDTDGGEVIEEGRVPTTPEALRRRFALEGPMRVAIETGTHSPWVSQLLEKCAHEVLVANARKLRLIYSHKQKTDEVDALRTWPAWLEWTRSCCTHSNTGAKRARPIWP
jgi:transposase